MANHGHHDKQEKETNTPTSQQTEGPPAKDPDPATPHNFTGHRGARHRPRPESEGPAEGQCQHIKSKTPSDEGECVPEVGLELHSGPCKYWEVKKTCAIRASPADVRPSPKSRCVDIVNTPNRKADASENRVPH